MNSVIMRAFYEELEKIADWSLAGPSLAQHSAESLAAGGPHGTFTSPDQLRQVMRQKEMDVGMQQRAGQLREAKMEGMLRGGQWNPQTHTVDMQGNLIPRAPMTVPRSQAQTVATKIVDTPGFKPQAARSMGRLRGIVGKAGRFGKAGLGAAALGLAGLGGYEAGQPAAATG